MSRTISFQIALRQGGVEPRTGTVAFLPLAGRKHKFVMHADCLTDYRTGTRVLDFGAIKIERMARISHCTRTTDRQAAAIALGRLIDRVGLETVCETIAAHPTVNE